MDLQGHTAMSMLIYMPTNIPIATRWQITTMTTMVIMAPTITIIHNLRHPGSRRMPISRLFARAAR